MILLKQTGTVAWFNPHLGFGQINPDIPETPDQQFFVHFKFIEQKDGYRKLTKSQKVRYYPVEIGDTKQAHQVEIIK